MEFALRTDVTFAAQPAHSPSSNVDLSIVIVNWNTRDLLTQCLSSMMGARTSAMELSRTTLPPGYDGLALNRSLDLTAEIIVVDNNSTDGSVSMVRENFPWVRLIENSKNVGFGNANNQAIALSRGRYILLLNSDTIVPPGAIPELVRLADARSDVGVVGCMLRNLDGSFQASYNSFPTLWGEWLSAIGLAGRLLSPQYPSHRESESNATKEVDWIPGAVMLLRACAVRQVGGFDETYVMYSEETDLCWRLRQVGWKVLYTPNAYIFHLGGGSASRTSIVQILRLYRSKKDFFLRQRGPGVARLYGWGVRLATVTKLGVWLAASVLPMPVLSLERRQIYRQKIRSHWPLVFGRW